MTPCEVPLGRAGNSDRASMGTMMPRWLKDILPSLLLSLFTAMALALPATVPGAMPDRLVAAIFPPGTAPTAVLDAVTAAPPEWRLIGFGPAWPVRVAVLAREAAGGSADGVETLRRATGAWFTVEAGAIAGCLGWHSDGSK